VFDARDGAVLEDPFGITPPSGGVDPLTRYPTRVVGGMVEVDLP
jgi:nitrite reductase/ring-hydroxylating ferredoxin subunit